MATELGAAQTIAKPFNTRELTTLVAQVLAKASPLAVALTGWKPAGPDLSLWRKCHSERLRGSLPCALRQKQGARARIGSRVRNFESPPMWPRHPPAGFSFLSRRRDAHARVADFLGASSNFRVRDDRRRTEPRTLTLTLPASR